ncbi:MAG: hypothetical protein AVDCRST_MAG50-2448, partial [uncultured Acidimicrobiales bacterium]
LTGARASSTHCRCRPVPSPITASRHRPAPP